MARDRAWKQPSSKTDDRAAETALLSQLEDAWMAARLLGKSKVTEQIVDDEYQGATSRGVRQTKAEFIKSVESSAGVFAHCVHSDRVIQIRGDTAISTGTATLSSPKRRVSFRYLRVFSKTKGKWRLIASQSTPLPAA